MTTDPLDLDAIEARTEIEPGSDLYHYLWSARDDVRNLIARVRELEAERDAASLARENDRLRRENGDLLSHVRELKTELASWRWVAGKSSYDPRATISDD